MKKFILPSIFAFGLLFSCNNDDDSSIDNANIVGTWNIVKTQIQYSKDNKIVDQKLDACEDKNTLTFTNDKKYSYVSYEADNTGKCVIEDTGNATYTITDKKIKVVYGPDDSFEAEIVSLTKNELVMKSSYGEDLDKDSKDEIEIYYLKR